MYGRRVRIRRGILACLLIASLSVLISLRQTKASAQRAERASEIARRDSDSITPVRYRDHLFTGATVTHDIAYRQTFDHDGHPITLRLDTYAPSGDDATNRPAVLWFHSGGFTAGSKAEETPYATDFAKRGYVSIAVDYRLRPLTPWFDLPLRQASARDAYDDAAAAVTWTRAHAASLGIDPSKIFAAGYSAGAITAFDLAYPPPGAAEVEIAGAVAIAGYTYGLPAAGAPPVLEFHGTEDPLIPYALGKSSCEQANGAGNRCELVTYTGGGHDIGTVRRIDIENRTAEFLAPLTDPSR